MKQEAKAAAGGADYDDFFGEENDEELPQESIQVQGLDGQIGSAAGTSTDAIVTGSN